jgi:hypothetical protein
VKALTLNAYGQRMNDTILSNAGDYPRKVTMLIGSLMRFSSSKDETQDENKGNHDDLMAKSLSKKLASRFDQAASQTGSHLDYKQLGLDDLSKITRDMLMDKNLEVSKASPFFCSLVETYVDRFQVFPFDTIKALFSYLETYEYPEEELRDLVKRLEKLYKKQHGSPVRESEPLAGRNKACEQILDDEISELRETLKYAAIVGERLDA